MEAKVCVLIDAENGEWKADLIREVFLEHKADSILSIPLDTLLPADRLNVALNPKLSSMCSVNARRPKKFGPIVICFIELRAKEILLINEKRYGGKNLAAAAIYRTTMTMLQEYYLAQENVSQTRDVSPCQNKWTPPPHGWYKVNTDGAMFSKQKWAGIGVIARDEQGRVVAAMSKRLQVPLGALEVEAKALEVAAGFEKDIGVQKVIFESDSLVVCSAI
uniref:RNase H type-1 domain-containing protein n=1 Tax=Quercus lobata TaxID=97700 RepID=A0A7N2LL65_QUELO